MLLFVGLGNPTPNSQNNRHNIGFRIVDAINQKFGLSKQKAKFGGSDAGHNGIASIDKFIGKDYSRVRIGIGKPEGKISSADYVLNDFNDEEKENLEKITNNIIDSISILIDKKLDLFSSTVNNN